MGCTMKTNATKTYCKENNKYEYDIAEGLKMSIEVRDNYYNIPLDTLFTMAARKNPKRSFLFVSKVLGKHIPINPYTGLLANRLLADKYMSQVYNLENKVSTQKLVEGIINQENCRSLYEEAIKNPYILPEPVIFIGFAETATGIAQGVFSYFQGKGFYTHTTRDVVMENDFSIQFQEEHSHATDHNCYGLKEDILKSEYPIVLIDDELTTGKTTVNIIKALQSKYPRKNYVVLSILDWRSDNDINRFIEIEKELGISIKVVSLVSGNIETEGSLSNDYINQHEEVAISTSEANVSIEYIMLDEYFDKPLKYAAIDENGNENLVPYLKETGRFGISCSDQSQINSKVDKIGQLLKSKRTGNNTLCLGTEEFIYIPMLIGANMGDGVKYHSTTRSPILPLNKDKYGAKNGFSFESPGKLDVVNYIYNIPYRCYNELFLILERELTSDRMDSIISVLKNLGIPKIFIVFCMSTENRPFTGSYSKDDVVFLLKDISESMVETDTEDKEEAIQSGVHYSEMLPVEYKPTDDYIKLFYDSLEESAKKVALATAVVAEKIIKNRGDNIVLVSLARAGTPIGILIKRYLENKYGSNLPHYGVSIIRGKGIDENAIKYILKHHPEKEIQFIDGWTGKGAITQVLIDACKQVKSSLGIDLNPDLAVLADPAYCTSTFGTREDFLIPSACLNATVSGLVSRTVHREDLIGINDFHGVKFYREMKDEDVSNLFIDRITAEFSLIKDEIEKELSLHKQLSHEIIWKGLEDIKIIQKSFNIEDINLIKPGIGETTRVLLRRVPWKILVRDFESKNLNHILLLAKDRGVTVEEYPHMTYECCGLIKPIE